MPSCVEDNKLECSNDITITNNCSTTSTSIQCTASFSDQSVVDVNDESEKSELNVIPNPFTQNNTNNFKDPTDWTNSNICRNYIAKFGYMIRTLMQILPHQNELILMMIVIVVNQSLRKTEKRRKCFTEMACLLNFKICIILCSMQIIWMQYSTGKYWI